MLWITTLFDHDGRQKLISSHLQGTAVGSTDEVMGFMEDL